MPAHVLMIVDCLWAGLTPQVRLRIGQQARAPASPTIRQNSWPSFIVSNVHHLSFQSCLTTCAVVSVHERTGKAATISSPC